MRRILIASVSVMLAVVALRYWWRFSRPLPYERESYSVAQALGGGAAPGYLRADKPRRFSFPADHGPHPGFRNEWWYFTGNLETADGRRFGYQLTFFKTALAPGGAMRDSRPAEGGSEKKQGRASAWRTGEVYMAHFAVTDEAAKRFRFAERFSRAALGLAGAGGDPLTIHLEDWAAVQTKARPWRVRLAAADPEMAIDLDLATVKPEILNGEGGLSRKSATPGNASYYYSIPRMATTGTVRLGGERFRVSGLSWLDREWSTSALEREQVGWDWFALHLSDGRDLMYYRLRRSDGGSDPCSGGTLVGADGSTVKLKGDEVQLQVGEWWESPAGGARYPSRWRLRIPSQGINLDVTPRLADQELLTGFRYWEGAVSVRGTEGSPDGSGYLEMTGYSAAPAAKAERAVGR